MILETLAIALVLILIATVRAWSDFDPAHPNTWLFVGGVSVLLVAVVALYVSLKWPRRTVLQGHALQS